ncbi:uncharacterized protein [Chironomus tepperi]|uniref:uncharacterized protein n=1 Tax=Chironomus tepperi TaxID=113505 RepID=UPI00391F2B6A
MKIDFQNFKNKVQSTDSGCRNVNNQECLDLTSFATLNERSPNLNELESKLSSEFPNFKYCENEDDIISKINSINIEDSQQSQEVVLNRKIKVSDNLINLNSKCLQILSMKCKNRSAVIEIESINKGMSRIYWKSKDIDEFLTLKFNDNVHHDEIRKLNGFISNFLCNSLIINHLGLIKKLSFHPGMNSISINLLADIRDFNLLLLAAEHGNTEIVEILLKQGMNTSSSDNKINAQTLAYQNQHFDVLHLLLQANLKFPDSFDASLCTGKCEEFCDVTEEVHSLIKANDNRKLKEILNRHKNLKHFYNFANESALKVAILKRSYDTYKELTGRKFRYASHEDPAEYLHDLDVRDKRIVREIHNNFSEGIVDKHINVLIGNSFIYHDDVDGQNKQNIIIRAYKSLDSIPLVRIILKIVAASKNFKIIFDFNRESVNVADPTVESCTQGLFYVSGRIYIGAKQLLNLTTEHEALANLAHELCHFTMNLVYNNAAKPYKANDKKVMKNFQEISDICEKSDEREDIVDMVYEAYPEEVYHAELIVRPVHMLVYYKNSPEILERRKETYSRLFEFYEKKVVPELEKSLPEIEHRDEKVIKKKDKKISKLRKRAIIGGMFSVIGIIAAIAIGIKLYKPVYKFKELSIHDQKVVEMCPIIYKNVSLKFVDLFPRNSNVYEKLESDHISQMLKTFPLNISDPHKKYLDDFVEHDWRNLTKELKEKILNSNFTFQNERVKFEKLYEVVPKSFDSLTSQQIMDVLDGKALNVSNMIKNETKFIVDRIITDENIFAVYHLFNHNYTDNNRRFEEFYEKFRNQSLMIQVKEIEENEYLKPHNIAPVEFYRNIDTEKLLSHKSLFFNLDGVLKIANETKIFILSAEAGTGKTETFVQLTMRIKYKFPSHWVSFIDLKDHKELYKAIETLNDVMEMFEKIFGLSDANKFEKEAFEELFKSGNAIFLWNGFDEISPGFSEAVLKILSIIENKTGNIQFICTRPLYKDLLRDAFMTEIYTLVPFTIEEQKNFIEKFLISQNIKNIKIPHYITKVRKILNATQSDEFDTPLLLCMISELVSNDVKIYKTENVYELYRKFVEKKIQIWQEKSAFAKQFVNNILISGFSIKNLHQQYALKTELQTGAYLKNFAYYNALKLKIMRQKVPEILSNDEISRMGILYINGPISIRFAHRTFAEFFIAQYFIENIYMAEDEPTGAEVENRIRTFYQILTPPFIKVRNFIMSFLLTKAGNMTKMFDSKVSKIIRTRFQKLYINSLRDSKVLSLLDFFTKDHKVLTELLQIDADETLYSAIFNYDSHASSNENISSNLGLNNYGKEHLTDIEYQKLIDSKNQKGIILFSFYCISRKNREIIKPGRIFHEKFTLNEELIQNDDPFFVFEEITRNLTKPELKRLLTSEIILNPIYTKHINNIFNEQMWKIVEENLNETEQKEMLQKFFNTTTIFLDERNLQFGLEKLPKLFSNSEIIEIFSNSSILIKAANFRKHNFQPLWNFFINHTNLDQQKSMLKQTNQNECFAIPYGDIYQVKHCYVFPALNMLQTSLFSYDNLDSFNRISNIYDTYFNKTEMQQIIASSSTEFLPIFIVEGYQLLCERFVDYLKELFSGNEDDLQKFLLREIEPTNMNVFDLLNGFNDPYSCLETFSTLRGSNTTLTI